MGMPLRRTVRSALSSAMAAIAAGAGLLAATAAPAQAADPYVSVKLSHPLVVNYLEECRPEAEVVWKGGGAGVKRVVMTQTGPLGQAYTERAVPESVHGLGVGCTPVDEFGKWTVRVVAYNGKGKALAWRSVSYDQKGNTKLTVDAAPEPVRRGATITVSGRLLRIKFGSAPWYVAYSGRPVKLYVRPAGASTWTYMGTATTGSDGRFAKRFTARRDGNWRAVFPGTTRYVRKTSAADYVDVR